jgi:hypothetical protein
LLQNTHDLRAEDLEVDDAVAIISGTVRNLPKTESNQFLETIVREVDDTGLFQVVAVIDR